MSRQVAGRAAREPEPAVPIGYRRDPVRISHEGWSLEVPGSYAERRTPDEWWGGGAGRAITLAATRTGLDDGTPMPAATFIDQFAGELGAGSLRHAEGEVLGRARLVTDASSGIEVGRARGLLGHPRLGRGDQGRIRRSRGLAVGRRDVAEPPARLTLSPFDAASRIRPARRCNTRRALGPGRQWWRRRRSRCHGS